MIYISGYVSGDIGDISGISPENYPEKSQYVRTYVDCARACTHARACTRDTQFLQGGTNQSRVARRQCQFVAIATMVDNSIRDPAPTAAASE